MAAAGFGERRFPDGRVLRLCSTPPGSTISAIGREIGITRQGAAKVVTQPGRPWLRGRSPIRPSVDARSPSRSPPVAATTSMPSEAPAQRIEDELRDRTRASGVHCPGALLDALGVMVSGCGCGTTSGTSDIEGTVMPYGSGHAVRQAMTYAKPWQRYVIAAAMVVGGVGLAAFGRVAGAVLAVAGAVAHMADAAVPLPITPTSSAFWGYRGKQAATVRPFDCESPKKSDSSRRGAPTWVMPRWTVVSRL